MSDATGIDNSDTALYKEISTLHLNAKSATHKTDHLIREKSLTIKMDGVEMIYLLCLPVDPVYLALGFLNTEGIITSKEQIQDIESEDDPLSVSIRTKNPDKLAGSVFMKRTVTSGCGKGVIFRNVDNAERPRIESDFFVELGSLEVLWKEINDQDNLYRRTRGVHSSAICTVDDIIYFSPDIGRHNTLDRIAGKCFWEDIGLEDKVLFCTGRFSSEMVFKLGAMGIPIAISRSTPTDLAVELADDMGITLASTKSMSRIKVYTHSFRILQ